MRLLRGIVILLAPALFFGFIFNKSAITKRVSLDFTSRILEKGKYITISGEMYYDINGKRMTTHLTKPFENVTIVNVNGEMKIYDPIDNTVVYSNSQVNTTESSYFHHFFNFSSSDMGLQKLGYVILSTKLDDGLIVTTWVPKEDKVSPIRSIELVHQKSDIVYMGVKSKKKRFLGKVYFSKYQKVGEFSIPMNIVEFGYSENGDSTVTKKVYSNPNVNEQVDERYVNFQIPKNAKVISPGN